MKKISVVIPCYNEQDNIENLYEAITEVTDKLTDYQWEILLIDDGSVDQTLQHIRELKNRHQNVGYVSLSRNFGKENALLAGFDHATGDSIIIMDADMQHPPYLIEEMVKEWENGYDDVYAKREDRTHEKWLKRTATQLYYRLLQRMAKIDVLPNVGDFRLLDRKCVDSLQKMRETQRYTKGLYCWIGFKKKEITFQPLQRTKGKSSFSYRKLINLSIEGITSYTTQPLRISTVMGLLVSLVAFLYMCYVLVKTILFGDPVQGYPTLIIVILFLGGIQLVSIGIIGEYLGRIFYETKNRPVYLVREKDGIN